MSLRINQNIEALTANRYLAQNDGCSQNLLRN